MPAIIFGFFTSVTAILLWIVEQFLPFIIKKFGLASVKLLIQKGLSVSVGLITIAMYLFFVTGIVKGYNIFSDFISTITAPSSSTAGAFSSEYTSCGVWLMNVSGFSAGLSAGLTITVVLFLAMFGRALYSVTRSSLALISEEVNKNLKLY